MAVQTTLESVKVVLNLEKGSQTVANCKKDATDEALFAVGKAVGTLQREAVESISKIEESILVML